MELMCAIAIMAIIATIVSTTLIASVRSTNKGQNSINHFNNAQRISTMLRSQLSGITHISYNDKNHQTLTISNFINEKPFIHFVTTNSGDQTLQTIKYKLSKNTLYIQQSQYYPNQTSLTDLSWQPVANGVIDIKFSPYIDDSWKSEYSSKSNVKLPNLIKFEISLFINKTKRTTTGIVHLKHSTPNLWAAK